MDQADEHEVQALQDVGGDPEPEVPAVQAQAPPVQPPPAQAPPVQAAAPDAQGFLQNLNELIRATVAQAQAGHHVPAVKLKVPTFNGKGDVELFLTQIQEIALSQEWDEETIVLKAREGLSGPAQECGRSGTWQGIVDTLRLHYGLTATEAEAKLASYRRTQGVSLAEFSTEIKKLVNVAYADAEEPVRQRLTMERFKLGVNHPGVQGHLLARQPETLEDMVRAGNEFLLVTKSSLAQGQPRVREVDDTKEEQVRQVTTDGADIQTITKAVEALTKELSELKNKLDKSERGSHSKGGRSGRPPQKQDGCWGCKQTGHIRKECPTNPWPAGNEEGPRQ